LKPIQSFIAQMPKPSSLPLEQLLTRIERREAVIGIIGLGYVGLPLALRFAQCGLRVIGFDIDPAKIDKLAAGQSYINYLPAGQIIAATASGFSATSDFGRLDEPDALIICVPTPLDRHRDPDLSFVLDTAQAIAKRLRAGQIVSLESTTYPGTTEEDLKPVLEATGLKVGEGIFLTFSPERQDPGNTRYGTHDIPKIVGGCTPACLKVGVALYQTAIDKVVPVSSPRVAEMAKLLENIHRAVNIGLVNEMKMVADAMGLGYLLCRAADTLADTRLVPQGERLKALETYRAAFGSGAAPKLALPEDFRRHQAGASESELLSRLDDCVALWVRFPASASCSRSRMLPTMSAAHAMSPIAVPPTQLSSGNSPLMRKVVPTVATSPKKRKTKTSPSA